MWYRLRRKADRKFELQQLTPDTSLIPTPDAIILHEDELMDLYATVDSELIFREVDSDGKKKTPAPGGMGAG